MKISSHSKEILINQWGLDGSEMEVNQFAFDHKDTDGVRLDEAEFLTRHQGAFIRESLLMDAASIGVIKQLNNALHKF
jgi:hypothetical protein